MKTRRTLFALLTMLMAIFVLSCAVDKTSSNKVGYVKMALQSSSGHCVTGDFTIASTSSSSISYVISNPDCSGVNPIPLVPGTYTISFPSPVCIPPTTAGYVGCVYTGSTPTPFTVSGNMDTAVALNFTFFYDLSTEEVVFNVGSASVTIAPPVEAELCGSLVSDPVCAVGQTCYILSPGTVPACYTTDCPTVACSVGQSCIVVALASQIGVPVPGGFASLPRICAPSTSGGSTGAGGASGVAGSAGSVSTGGSISNGGISGVAGSSTNGGTSGVAGSSSGVGGASSTGGVAATGGTVSTGGTSSVGGAVSTGGTTAQSGMTCSVAGLTVSCVATNCSQAAIVCVNNGNGLVWGACACQASGTGGSPSIGGASSVGGTNATGGVAATGGTTAVGGTAGMTGIGGAVGAGGNVVVRCAPPAGWSVNYANYWRVPLDGSAWDGHTNVTTDADPGATFELRESLPVGWRLEVTFNMTDANGVERWAYDFSSSLTGSGTYGVPQCQFTEVTVNGAIVAPRYVSNPISVSGNTPCVYTNLAAFMPTAPIPSTICPVVP